MSTITRLVLAPIVASGFSAGAAGATAAPAESDDDIVIQFTTGGGITGPCCDFWDLPEITVYADGGAVLANYGEAQLPEITVATLTNSVVKELLADAADAGLLDAKPPDTGALCCDLAYTRVVLDDGSRSTEFQVTGLGLEQEGDELTEAQREVRGAVLDLRDRLRMLVLEEDTAAEYVPKELALLVAPPRDEPVGQPPAWPLDEPLADGLLVGPGNARCVFVTGDDVQVVLDAAGRSETAVWTSGGEPWTVFVRPLLPAEHRCPEGDEWALERDELGDRRTQWILSGVFDNYEMVVTAHCFCPTEYTTPRHVTVVDGEIDTVEPEPPAGFDMPVTVDDLFELIERGFDEADVVDVSYDDEFGFPDSIFIDWNTMTMDEESAYEVTDFRPTA